MLFYEFIIITFFKTLKKISDNEIVENVKNKQITMVLIIIAITNKKSLMNIHNIMIQQSRNKKKLVNSSF